MRPVTLGGMDLPPSSSASLLLAVLASGDSRGGCPYLFRMQHLQTSRFRIHLAFDFCFTQLPYGGLGADGGIVDLFKVVGLGLGGHHRQDFNVPVIVVVDRLPIAQIL